MFVNISNGLFVLRAALLSSLVIHAICNIKFFLVYVLAYHRGARELAAFC